MALNLAPLDVRSTSSGVRVVQTPPFWEIDGELAVLTEVVQPDGPPPVVIDRTPSAPGQDWSPLGLDDVAWEDRDVSDWLGDTPLHLAANAMKSKEFIGHMAMSIGVVTGAPALDNRLVPFAFRGTAALGLPALGYLLLR